MMRQFIFPSLLQNPMANRNYNYGPGATLEAIVTHVLEHTNLSEDTARMKVFQVLHAGIRMKRIIELDNRRFALASIDPLPSSKRIREPKLIQDSSDSDTSD